MKISFEESLPQVVGKIDVVHKEMCFTMYMPIKMPEQGIQDMLNNIPPEFKRSMNELVEQIWMNEESLTNLHSKYMYITVKHTYVSPESMSQRMGWHIDSFGSDGINYIWYSDVPTEICAQEFDISENDAQSLRDMEEQSTQDNIITIPSGHLLRLDNKVVHRVSENHDYSGMRTFVKVSISDKKFNLIGNAKNHYMDYDWKMHSRAELRNLESNDDYA